MNIAVISSSPKGEASITFHSLLWIKKNAEEHNFTTFHVGKNKRCWDDAYEAMLKSDIVVFVYPVYTFLAPSRLHEFIHFVKSKGALEQKEFAQITTSKHFYDTTAHAWLCDNCADLQMKYLGGLSADMDDLLTPAGRKEALDFWKLIVWRKKSAVSLPIRKIESQPFAYSSKRSATDCKFTVMKPDVVLPPEARVEDKISVVASIEQGDSELVAMINDFAANSSLPVEVFNVNEFPFKGSCISCFNCASTGKCMYVDNFDTYLRRKILTARAIVYAYRVCDHSMGVRMKIYDDRQFCNGHRTVTMGMPVGFIVAGDLREEENLRLLMNARVDVGGNFMAGIAQDYNEIEALAHTIDFSLKEQLSQSRMFLGVGGMKIFRDLIWMMQGLMRADHKFFKSHGQYDFPQKRRGDMLKMYLVGALMSNPKIRRKAATQIAEGMIAPYRKALENEK